MKLERNKGGGGVKQRVSPRTDSCCSFLVVLVLLLLSPLTWGVCTPEGGSQDETPYLPPSGPLPPSALNRGGHQPPRRGGGEERKESFAGRTVYGVEEEGGGSRLSSGPSSLPSQLGSFSSSFTPEISSLYNGVVENLGSLWKNPFVFSEDLSTELDPSADSFSRAGNSSYSPASSSSSPLRQRAEEGGDGVSGVHTPEEGGGGGRGSGGGKIGEEEETRREQEEVTTAKWSPVLKPDNRRVYLDERDFRTPQGRSPMHGSEYIHPSSRSPSLSPYRNYPSDDDGPEDKENEETYSGGEEEAEHGHRGKGSLQSRKDPQQKVPPSRSSPSDPPLSFYRDGDQPQASPRPLFQPPASAPSPPVPLEANRPSLLLRQGPAPLPSVSPHTTNHRDPDVVYQLPTATPPTLLPMYGNLPAGGAGRGGGGAGDSMTERYNFPGMAGGARLRAAPGGSEASDPTSGGGVLFPSPKPSPPPSYPASSRRHYYGSPAPQNVQGLVSPGPSYFDLGLRARGGEGGGGVITPVNLHYPHEMAALTYNNSLNPHHTNSNSPSLLPVVGSGGLNIFIQQGFPGLYLPAGGGGGGGPFLHQQPQPLPHHAAYPSQQQHTLLPIPGVYTPGAGGIGGGGGAIASLFPANAPNAQPGAPSPFQADPFVGQGNPVFLGGAGGGGGGGNNNGMVPSLMPPSSSSLSPWGAVTGRGGGSASLSAAPSSSYDPDAWWRGKTGAAWLEVAPMTAQEVDDGLKEISQLVRNVRIEAHLGRSQVNAAKALSQYIQQGRLYDLVDVERKSPTITAMRGRILGFGAYGAVVEFLYSSSDRPPSPSSSSSRLTPHLGSPPGGHESRQPSAHQSYQQKRESKETGSLKPILPRSSPPYLGGRVGGGGQRKKEGAQGLQKRSSFPSSLTEQREGRRLGGDEEAEKKDQQEERGLRCGRATNNKKNLQGRMGPFVRQEPEEEEEGVVFEGGEVRRKGKKGFPQLRGGDALENYDDEQNQPDSKRQKKERLQAHASGEETTRAMAEPTPRETDVITLPPGSGSSVWPSLVGDVDQGASSPPPIPRSSSRIALSPSQTSARAPLSSSSSSLSRSLLSTSSSERNLLSRFAGSVSKDRRASTSEEKGDEASSWPRTDVFLSGPQAVSLNSQKGVKYAAKIFHWSKKRRPKMEEVEKALASYIEEELEAFKQLREIPRERKKRKKTPREKKRGTRMRGRGREGDPRRLKTNQEEEEEEEAEGDSDDASEREKRNVISDQELFTKYGLVVPIEGVREIGGLPPIFQASPALYPGDTALFFANRLIVYPALKCSLDMLLQSGNTSSSALQPPLSRNAKRVLLRRMVTVVAGLHQLGFTHNDIKPQNFLVGADGLLYLGDFAYLIPIDSVQDCNRGFTIDYTPPELMQCALKNASLGMSTYRDSWAVAVSGYQILCKNHLPFFLDKKFGSKAAPKQVAAYIASLQEKDVETSRCGEDYDREAMAFVLRLLQPDISKRATVEDLVKEPFFSYPAHPPLLEEEEEDGNAGPRDEDGEREEEEGKENEGP